MLEIMREDASKPPVNAGIMAHLQHAEMVNKDEVVCGSCCLILPEGTPYRIRTPRIADQRALARSGQLVARVCLPCSPQIDLPPLVP